MIKRVISGFQTGVDRGAIFAAHQLGISTGGWMPRGFLAEDGCHYEYEQLYGAQEHICVDYPSRTRENVKDSQATIWLGQADSAGFKCTYRYVMEFNRPMLVIREGEFKNPGRYLIDYILDNKFEIINFAGPRESKCPGIQDKVEKFLYQVFKKLIKEN